MMRRSEVIEILRAHEHEFRAAGVVGMSLFGSVARDEPEPGDVDIAIRTRREFSGPGLDHIRALDELEQRITTIVGRKVDIIEEPVRRPAFQEQIDRDRVRAF